MAQPLTKTFKINVLHPYPRLITIDVLIDRDLTEEEIRFISNCNNDISELLHKTSVTTDPKWIVDTAEEKTKLLNCFPTPIYVQEIPNEYGMLNPWYLVATHCGVIKIGWRRRVIHIDWSASNIKSTGYDLFEYDNSATTISDKFIHAWGYDKAKEYINKLLTHK